MTRGRRAVVAALAVAVVAALSVAAGIAADPGPEGVKIPPTALLPDLDPSAPDRLEARIATVDLNHLPAEFAGRKFDLSLMADLPVGVDPCGENGEFHTCVVAGPIFSRRLPVVTGERVERDGYAYCDLVLKES